ncbi:MAG: hypothetical protein WC325_13755 [Candidatus Bathyarchaeia archaeon]
MTWKKTIGKLGGVARSTARQAQTYSSKAGVKLGEARKRAVDYGERVNRNTRDSPLLSSTGFKTRDVAKKTKPKSKAKTRSGTQTQTVIIIKSGGRKTKKRRTQQRQGFSLI